MIPIPWRKVRRASAGILLAAALGCFVLLGLELSEFHLRLRPVKQKRTRLATGRLSALLKLQGKQQNGDLIDVSSKRPADVNPDTESHVGLETRSLQEKLDWTSNHRGEQGIRLPVGLSFSPSATIRTSRSIGFDLPSVTRSDTLTTRSLAAIIGENRVETASASIAAHTQQLPTVESEAFRFETHRQTELQDIFISVKTTNQFHNTRVVELLRTWVGLTTNQVFFFTDRDDEDTVAMGANLINTDCPVGHQRSALCCKMSAELNYFVEKVMSRWFCHFDDDNYVNVPILIQTLRKYNHTDDVYLGRISLNSKMKAYDGDDSHKVVAFWFATGGAGFCLSRYLVKRMVPYIRGDRFMYSCDRVRVPDDCTIGFITEHLLGVEMTELLLFHSHLENLPSIMEHEFSQQITFSHGLMGGRYNRIRINGPFSEDEDPSRFKSLHCFLFPKTEWCPRASLTNSKTSSLATESANLPNATRT